MAVFTPINDENRGPTTIVRDDRGVITVSKFGHVDTTIVSEALTATGLPAIGSPLEAALPLVTLRSIRATYIGGQGRADAINKGWMWVELQYSSALGGSLNPADTETWFEMSGSTTTFTAKRTIDGQTIAAGEGLPKETGVIEAVVHTYYQANDIVQWERFTEHATNGYVNSDAVTLQRLLRTDRNWQLPARTARYRYFTTAIIGNLLEVNHHLALSINADIGAWEVLNPDGRFERTETGRVYPTIAFGDLLD